jgi:hypothetical protein
LPPLITLTSLVINVTSLVDELLNALIQACPSLTRFSLIDTDTNNPIPLQVWRQLPISLEAIHIYRPETILPALIETILPSFDSLSRIVLEGPVFSDAISNFLHQLPSLIDIQLSYGNLDLAQFNDLVSGPTRLPRLRSLVINEEMGVVCDRVSYRDGDCCHVDGLSTMFEWVLPRWGNPDKFKPRAIKELIAARRENGIRVKGTIIDALEISEDYYIELNNRLVIEAYYSKSRDFSGLVQAHSAAAQHDYFFPDIDFDSLGDQLEIVETELPENKWFLWTLRNESEGGDGKVLRLEKRGEVPDYFPPFCLLMDQDKVDWKRDRYRD